MRGLFEDRRLRVPARFEMEAVTADGDTGHKRVPTSEPPKTSGALQEPVAVKNPWEEAYKAALEKLANREPFEYDANGDAVYHQYKENAQKSAELAMKDTVAQIAACNGGYGNSYAQTAGQQIYQSTIQEADDMIPELYDIALERYNRETDELRADADTASDAYFGWEELRADAEEKAEDSKTDDSKTDEGKTNGLNLSPSATLSLSSNLRDLVSKGDYAGVGLTINALEASDDAKVSLLEDRVLKDLRASEDYEGICEVIDLIDLSDEQKVSLIESWVPSWCLDGYDSLKEYESETGRNEASDWVTDDGNLDRWVEILEKGTSGVSLTDEEQEIFDMMMPYMGGIS